MQTVQLKCTWIEFQRWWANTQDSRVKPSYYIYRTMSHSELQIIKRTIDRWDEEVGA